MKIIKTVIGIGILVFLSDCDKIQKVSLKPSPKLQPGVSFSKTHSTEKPSVTDSVFTNVTWVEDKDMTRKKDTLIFTKKINSQKPVIFIQDRVPLKALPWIYPEFPRIIVITPNWTQYEQVAASAPEGGCAEPSPSTVVYEFLRKDGRVIKDSVIWQCEFPTFK